MTLGAKTLEELIHESYHCAVEKGWWENPHEGVITEKLLLMVTEIAEATEEIRNGHEPTEVYYNDAKPGKPEGFGIEIADLLIRTFDLCEHLGVDLEECLNVKMAYNRTRPHRHGGKKL